MQKVIKNIFLLGTNRENNLKFYTLLGPFFLFLTISLATFDFAIFTTLSLFMCFRFRTKGLIVSLIGLVIFSFYTQINLEEKYLWTLGLQTSIALGLVISTFGFEEIKEYLNIGSKIKNIKDDSFKEFEKREKSYLALHKNFQENISILKTDIQNKNSRIDDFLKENEKLKNDLLDNQLKKDYLFNELDLKDKEIEKLKSNQDELFEKISFLKEEEFLQEDNKKLKKDIEDLSISLKKEKEKYQNMLNDFENKSLLVNELEKNISYLKMNNQTLIENENILNEKIKKITEINSKKSQEPQKEKLDIKEDIINQYHNLSSLYQQLRDQFDEKQVVLHSTRQELFKVKENLTALQQEANEDFKDITAIEKGLLNDLFDSCLELESYILENERLKELVTILLEKKESKANEKKT